MTNPKNEISRFARNDGSCRRWWGEGGGEATPFTPMTLINECDFEQSEKSQHTFQHRLSKSFSKNFSFNSSSTWGRIQYIFNTVKRF